MIPVYLGVCIACAQLADVAGGGQPGGIPGLPQVLRHQQGRQVG